MALVAATSPLVATAQPSAAAPPTCTTRDATYDSRDVACTIDAARPLLFRAEFSGGHDDTMASMTVAVDGKPADCEGGGKLRLMGEDGLVHLSCRLAAPAAGSVLRATIKWSHAEYVGAALKAD